MIAIKIEELTKSYNTGFWGKKIRAIDNINFIVESGKIFGFLGLNGAGKTTTIKILTGLLFPDRGEVFLFDQRLPDVSVLNRVGYLPEHPSFYSHLTGYELLDFYGSLFGLTRKQRHKRLEELLELVGLTKVANQGIKTYSKGMIQRLGIAQALINRPDLLILDEPMEGLDPIGRKDVKDIMLELKKDGKTIFFSTHILPDVEAVCDRVGIIHNGRMVSVGNLEELFKKTAKSVEIIVQALSDEVISKIKNKVAEVNRLDNNTQLIVTDSEVSDEVIDLVRQHNGKIVSIIPHRKTLEEYFVTKVSEEK